ncbi:MAG: hypothetical protein H0X24_03410 [Ktedonobacterales bacterium]|nr:hypothetical protein [Ktedonobacterales bacterium]
MTTKTQRDTGDAGRLPAPLAVVLPTQAITASDEHSLDTLLALPRVRQDPILTERISQAAWTCPQCGVMVPKLYAGGRHVLVRRVRCACGPEPLARYEAEERAEQRRVASDRARSQAVFGGTHPGTASWLKRFAAFERAFQPEAYDALRGWCLFIGQMYHQHLQAAQAPEQHAGELRFRLAWSAALRRIPSLILTGGACTGKTHLLLACLHQVCDASDHTQGLGIRIAYLPGMAYLDAIRATWDQPDGLEEPLIVQASSADVLLVDGIDGVRSAWAGERWRRILIERSLKGYPILIAGTSVHTIAEALGRDTYHSLAERAMTVNLTVNRRPRQTTLSLTDLQHLGHQAEEATNALPLRPVIDADEIPGGGPAAR